MQQAHRHHEHEGKALATAARRTMETAGERWTDMRSEVFSTLARQDKAASAYEIADAISRARGKRVAPNSVYRILDLFVATNLARKVESANAYVANSHPGCVHDCIFLVCDDCGQITHLDDDRLSEGVRQAARAEGFIEERPVIEVRGKCAYCH